MRGQSLPPPELLLLDLQGCILRLLPPFVPRRVKGGEVLQFVDKAIVNVLFCELLIVEILVYITIYLLHIH